MRHGTPDEHDTDDGMTRRNALRTAAGVVAGAVVGAMATGATAADAAAGGNFILGVSNSAGTSETLLHTAIAGDHGTLAVFNDYAGAAGSGNLPDGLRVFATGPGIGAAIEAYGGPNTFSAVTQPNQGVGVRSIGTLRGVYAKAIGPARTGTTLVGVEADGDSYGVLASSAKGSGVYASTTSPDVTIPAVHGVASTGPGVLGDSTTGTGVQGRSSGAGTVGVLGTTNTGGTAIVASSFVSNGGDGSLALDVIGRPRFSTAGVSTIASGTSKLKVFPNCVVAATTKVLATLQGPGGTLKFARPNTADNSFVLQLTANATASVNVAWFVFE